MGRLNMSFGQFLDKFNPEKIDFIHVDERCELPHQFHDHFKKWLNHRIDIWGEGYKVRNNKINSYTFAKYYEELKRWDIPEGVKFSPKKTQNQDKKFSRFSEFRKFNPKAFYSGDHSLIDDQLGKYVRLIATKEEWKQHKENINFFNVEYKIGETMVSFWIA